MQNKKILYIEEKEDGIVVGYVCTEEIKIYEETLEDTIRKKGSNNEIYGAEFSVVDNRLKVVCPAYVAEYKGMLSTGKGAVYISASADGSRQIAYDRARKRIRSTKDMVTYDIEIKKGKMELIDGYKELYYDTESGLAEMREQDRHKMLYSEGSLEETSGDVEITSENTEIASENTDIASEENNCTVDILEITEDFEKSESLYERYNVVPNRNCIRCKGEGVYLDATFGIEVTCDCVVSMINRDKEVKPTKPVYHTNKGTADIAVAKGLIPKERVNDEYSADTAATRISVQYGARYTIRNFKAYSEVLNTIITSINTNIPIGKSYMLGAPNGSGKTTFANTCIKRLEAMGMKAVPYVSLMEVADLRSKYENYLSGLLDKKKGFSYSNVTEDKVDYTWMDYVSADVAFVYLSGIDNANVEVRILRMLLQMRGNKGLPTIVFREESLELYRSDDKMRLYYWDEIISKHENLDSYDRLTNVYCMKSEKTIGLVRGEDY